MSVDCSYTQSVMLRSPSSSGRGQPSTARWAASNGSDVYASMPEWPWNVLGHSVVWKVLIGSFYRFISLHRQVLMDSGLTYKWQLVLWMNDLAFQNARAHEYAHCCVCEYAFVCLLISLFFSFFMYIHIQSILDCMCIDRQLDRWIN